MTDTPELLVRQGRVGEALGPLEEAVRRQPGDVKLRRFFSHVLALLGHWKRAASQMEVVSDLEPKEAMTMALFATACKAELERQEVFSGRGLPTILGDPPPWAAAMAQANLQGARGQSAAAEDLRQGALEDAPAMAGSINGTGFQWLADADGRLGPILEAILGGGYTWIPMTAIGKITLEAPTDLQDLVWARAEFTWDNGENAFGLIPVRYPGAELSTDNGLRMSRRTHWEESPEGLCTGQGQRMFATDQGEYPLLETRLIEMG